MPDSGGKNHMAGRVFAFWSWNDIITEEGITRRLEDFADGKFDGAVIHARAGLLIPYLSERWFSLFGHAVNEAERLGLEIFIYDEDGWPSGFAGGIVPASGDEYRLKRLKTGYIKSSAPYERLVAVYRGSGGAFSEISYPESRDGDLFLWYDIDPDYADLLSEETVRRFINSTHEQYRLRFSDRFGTTIKGFFTDEPQLSGYLPWSPLLEKAYREAFGEELRPLMWMLTADAGEYRSFRSKYYTAVRGQFGKAFTSQIGKWCSDNNLIFTGHFGCEDGLCLQLPSNAGVMAQYRFMRLPGIDHLGNRVTSPVLVKQASSASRQFSDGCVLSETFGCSGWDAELPRLAWLWGRQTALGVTTACCHLSAYSVSGVRKRDYPAFFSCQSPFWQVFDRFKKWMSALSDAVSEGGREVEALVISPLNTVAAHYNGSFDSERMRACSAEFRILTENLLDLQLDADIGDEDLISACAYIKNGKFCVGNCEYSNIFVSDCDSLLPGVWLRLREFADCGGRVAFINRYPAFSGFNDKSDKILSGAAVLENRRGLIEKYLLRCGIKRRVRLLNSYDLSTASGYLLQVRKTDFGSRVQICGKEDGGADVILRIEGNYALIRRNFTGGEDERLCCTCSGGYTFAALRTEKMENIVIDAVSGAGTGGTAYRLKSAVSLLPESVRPADKNCLTLDRAYYIVNGESSEEMPVIKITPRLYELAEAYGAPVEAEVVYTFYISSDTGPMDMTLALEDGGCRGFSVNGRSDCPPLGSWIDGGIREYDISGQAVRGKNTVSVSYRIEGGKTALNEEEIFETQRNRFFFPVEAESVYIRGNFDTVPDGGYTDRIDHFRVSGGFKISEGTEKRFGELTVQGLWFYRGDMIYTFEFECGARPEKCILRLEDAHCAAFCWELNGKSGVVVTYPSYAEITGAARPGKNLLKLRLIGGNRNLLGPHHHLKGRNMFVGPHTFTGVYGFEDFVSPELTGGSTWTDEYSFVPFGCGNVTLELYEKKEENV